ncbi:MAG: carbonic anhydrase [Desulfitobacterium hafniense]|nr:carbonic anhydrase [Desulfitobacterium hafniense]
MTRLLEDIMLANHRFVEAKQWQLFPPATATPLRKVALFTCMDSRLTEFIVPALGLQRGDAKIIKNAGNTFLNNLNDSVILSLAVAIYKLGVEEILVIGHYDCGVAETRTDELLSKMQERGIPEEVRNSIEPELDTWLSGVSCTRDNVKNVCQKIRTSPILPKDVPIHGLLIHPLTGMLQVVEDGYGYLKAS